MTASSHRLRVPVRRALEERPRAPRPPGRGADHPVGELGRRFTRWVTPLQPTALGAWLQSRIDRGRQFRHVQIELGRGDRGLDGLRVAMLSDLHVGFFLSAADFADLARRVRAWEPDLICLVGDLVDHEPEQTRLLGPGLELLRAPLGVVAVPGNHEYAAERDLKLFQEALVRADVTPLWNRGLRVQRGGASLFVAGVDDLTAGDPDLAAALQGLQEEEPALLLSHHPDLFVEAAHAGVDLTLAGHTHGGQVTWFGRPLLPGTHHTRLGYWQGLHRSEGAQLLVGRGAGTCMLPVRIHTPAEVLLVELRVPGEARPRDC